MATPLDSDLKAKVDVQLSEVDEFGVLLRVNKESLSPKKNEGYYCREMDVNRAFVTTALSVYCESGQSVFTPVKCADVLGCTGVAGFLWKKFLKDSVNVLINDSHDMSHQLVKENSQRNNLDVLTVRRDSCVLLHENPFSFIYVDCHTDAAIFLDAMMRNVPKQGMIAITTKDDGALYGRTPEMALRNYGGVITRTFYFKELAARLIIAGMVRAAAVHNKGLEVLGVLCVKSTITIIVKVLKGPAHANSTVAKLRNLIHCNICEDRAFYPSTIYPLEKPTELLSCKCVEDTPGKVVVNLGPIWSDSLYNIAFIRDMISHLPKFPWSGKLKEVIMTLLYEASCPNLGEHTALSKTLVISEIQRQSDEGEEQPPSKRKKLETSVTHSKGEPPFYFNLHKHCPKLPKMLKTNQIVSALHKAGFRASRTHFDPLAVRTNASLCELTDVISQSVK